jgi:dihydrofolate reductase
MPATTYGIILAATRDGGIGKQGAIPWRLPQDLARFRSITMGAAVIMGRNTWESLPAQARPLRGRQNIVIANRETLPGACNIVGSLDEALAAVEKGRAAWVIGGASLFNGAKTDHRCTSAHITLVEYEGECDTFVDIDGICTAFSCVKTMSAVEDNGVATLYGIVFKPQQPY